MRRLFTILTLLTSLVAANAQTQQVHIKTRGRLNSDGTVQKGSDIPNATLSLGGGSSHVSDGRGALSFNVGDNKTYVIKDIRKNNYQICDRDILGIPRTLSKDVFEIAMQTPDEALEDRLESEEKIRATLTAELNKQKAELRRLKEEQRITQQEYNEKLKALYDDQSTNEKFISEMAERYSTMDFDQLDEFQSRVAFYIRNGELARADSLLKTKGDMVERSAELDRMDAAIKADSEDIAQRQIAHNAAVEHKAKKLEEFAADCYSRFEMCKLQHTNDSAAFWLELRASKDSLNIEWQLEAGQFLVDYLADYNNAMEYYRIALSNSLSIFGEDHPNVANSYNKIGIIYDLQGDYVRALEYYTKALDIRKNIFDEQHPDVAGSYNNIGLLCSAQGDYVRALEFCTKALDIQKRMFDEEHPAVAGSYVNIGIIYSYQGDYARALEYYTKALDIRTKILAEEHPDVAMTNNNIGTIYTYQGDYARALEYYTKALEMRKKILGEEHPDVATSYNNIGGSYSYQGDYARALEYYTKALEIQKKILGEEHPDVAFCYGLIGAIHMNLHDFANSEKCYKLALENFERLFTQNPDAYCEMLAAIYWHLMNLYAETNDIEQYDSYLENTMNLYEALYKLQPELYINDVIELQNRKVWRLMNNGKIDEAMQLATTTYTMDNSNEMSKAYLAECYNMKAFEYAKESDYLNAQQSIDKAISLMPTDANFYDSKGEIFLMQGKTNEALEMWKEVLELNSNFLDKYPEGTNLSNGLRELGLIK